MLFKREDLSAIASGAITTAFRRWRRPTIREGGLLRTAVGVLAIESVEVVLPEDISEQASRAAGRSSIRTVLDELSDGPGQIYQIRFRLIGEDPRIALRAAVPQNPADLEPVAAALRRLDRSTEWTAWVLELIRERPGVSAAVLAENVGMERLDFKRRVRQLKELGLTESLPVGYRLSPRGEAVLEHLKRTPPSLETAEVE